MWGSKLIDCTDSETTNDSNVDCITHKPICPHTDRVSRGVKCETCTYDPQNRYDYYETSSPSCPLGDIPKVYIEIMADGLSVYSPVIEKGSQ